MAGGAGPPLPDERDAASTTAESAAFSMMLGILDWHHRSRLSWAKELGCGTHECSRMSGTGTPECAATLI